MKHQYFGDINDFRKYGVLRVLTGGEKRLGIFWMFTEDDGRTDRKFTRYLSEPHRWRMIDPELFDILAGLEVRSIRRGKRDPANTPSGTRWLASQKPGPA